MSHTLQGKVFEDATGNIVKVNKVEGNIAHLSNNTRVAVERIMDNNHFQEQANPDTFLNQETSFYKSLGEQLKGIDTNNMNESSGYETGPKISNLKNPVESHHQAQATLKGDYAPGTDPDLERKRKEMADNYANMNQKVQSSNNKFKDYIDENDTEDQVPVNRNLEGATFEGQHKNQNQNFNSDPRDTSVTMYDDENQVVNQYSNDNNPSEPQRVIPRQDPIYDMFSQVKRSNKFSLAVELEELIPKKDFMKMWEESYKVSIIDYLVDEFTTKLLNDPTMIRNQLTEALKDYTFGKKRNKTKSTKPKSTKKSTKSGEKSKAINENSEETKK